MIVLKLSDKTIELNTYEVDGKQLYKAQDLLYGYGMDKEKVKYTIKNWVDSLNSKGVNYTPLAVKGKYGGTYLSKRYLLKLAGYVSYKFEDIVYEAFEELSNGEVQKASNIVESVAVSQELIDKAFAMEDALKVAINKWKGDKERTFQAKHICIRKHILSKTLTGNPNIKELREMFDGKNFVDVFRKLNHKVGLTAFIEITNIIIPMLEADLSYYVIEDMIDKMPQRWDCK